MKSRVLGALASCGLASACVVDVPGVELGGEVQSVASPAVAVNWSVEARNTIVTVGAKFPCLAGVYMGIVHAAMYDAVVGIEGGYTSYADHGAAAEGASAEAALAQAAHDVLAAKFPAQAARLDTVLAASLASIPEDGKADGVAFGQEVAADILALREGDGIEVNPPYVPGTGPGEWVPGAGNSAVGTGLGLARPLMMDSGDQFRPDPPPAPGTAEFAAEVAYVRAIGSSTSTTRTAAQTETARFFVEHAVPQTTRALVAITTSEGLTLAETARMLAMSWLSAGDSCIACHDAKYTYRRWRPITAIRNDPTNPDPTWTSVIGLPNHPSYPSAHGCYTEAVAQSLKNFFGTDHVDFQVSSTSSGTTHDYERFTDLAKEVFFARPWGGIHYVSDQAAGAQIGRKVAKLTTDFFRPID